jgi:hypothetical protein
MPEEKMYFFIARVPDTTTRMTQNRYCANDWLCYILSTLLFVFIN